MTSWFSKVCLTVFTSSRRSLAMRFKTNISAPAVLLVSLCLLGVSLAESPDDTQPETHVNSFLEAPGFTAAETDEDMQPLYEASLMEDISLWKRKLDGKKLTMQDFENFTNSAIVTKVPDTHRVILFYNNTLLFPRNSDPSKLFCEHPCNILIELLTYNLGAFLRGHHPGADPNSRRFVDFPNVVITLYGWDNPYSECSPKTCSIPQFSYIKRWTDKQHDEDILVPQMKQRSTHLHFFPWEKKYNRAFFRGSAYCFGPEHVYVKCTRTYFAMLTHYNKTEEDLDVGVTSGWGIDNKNELKEDPKVIIPKARPVSIHDHARYRYLLQLDGVSASYRFFQLLHINSLVLKQNSEFIEFFSRMAQPDVHYIPFWNTSKDDVFAVVRSLKEEAAKDPSRQQKIVNQAQHFAYKYTNAHQRALYWRRALTEYKELFEGMDEYIEKLVHDLRQKGAVLEHPTPVNQMSRRKLTAMYKEKGYKL